MLVSARGFEFDVFEGGPENGMPIVLLHGFPQHSGQWEAVTPALHEAGLRTIAINQRGYSPGARPTRARRLRAFRMRGRRRVHYGRARPCELPSRRPRLGCRGRLAAELPPRPNVSAPSPRSACRTGAPCPRRLRDPDSDQRSRSSYMFVFADLEKAVPLLLEDDAIRLRALFIGSGMTEEHVERYAARCGSRPLFAGR